MSTRNMITPIILALTGLAALGPASAAAERHRTTHTVQGKVWGIASVNVQTRELFGVSSGTMSPVGRVLIHLRGLLAPAAEPGTGPFTIVARNGDTITGTFAFVADPPNPDPDTAVMTLTIAGGTGQYEGATGSITAVNHLTVFQFPAAGSPFVLETVEATSRGYITY